MTRNRQKEDIAFTQLDPLERGVMEGGWWWLFQRHWGGPHVGHGCGVHLMGAQVMDTVTSEDFTRKID